MPRLRPSFFLLPLALVAMAVAMTASASLQRTAATKADDRADGASALLTAMIDQETGLRGFLLTGEESFLEPFHAGRVHAQAAEAVVSHTSAGDGRTLQLLRSHERAENAWEAMARRQIAVRRLNRDFHGTVAEALERKNVMDQLRAINA